jgi:hypothetical protein
MSSGKSHAAYKAQGYARLSAMVPAEVKAKADFLAGMHGQPLRYVLRAAIRMLSECSAEDRERRILAEVKADCRSEIAEVKDDDAGDGSNP